MLNIQLALSMLSNLAKKIRNKITVHYNHKQSTINNINHSQDELFFQRIKPRDYDKVFVIGLGKTGTTSLEKILIDMGFQLGNQAAGEMLIDDYGQKEFHRIVNYYHSAEAFQDIPCSLPEMYRIIDRSFPKSKFILTIRDNSEEWFESLIRFHTKIFSSSINPPSELDLKDANYRYKSWALHAMQIIFNYPKIPLYEPSHYKSVYEKHINDVKSYFKNREDLQIINLKDYNSINQLCKFLGFSTPNSYTIPHLNTSK